MGMMLQQERKMKMRKAFSPGPDGVEAARGRDGGTRLEGRSPQAGDGPPAGAMATRRRARLPIEQVYDYSSGAAVKDVKIS